jgi:hypothetical protein
MQSESGDDVQSESGEEEQIDLIDLSWEAKADLVNDECVDMFKDPEEEIVFEAPELPYKVEVAGAIARMIDDYYTDLGLDELDGDAGTMYEEAVAFTETVTNKYELDAKRIVDGWLPNVPSDEALARPMTLGSMGIEELEKQIDDTVAKYQLNKYTGAGKEASQLISNMPADSVFGEDEVVMEGFEAIFDALDSKTEDEDLQAAMMKTLAKDGSKAFGAVNAVTSGLAAVAPKMEEMEKDIVSTFDDFDTILKDAME